MSADYESDELDDDYQKPLSAEGPVLIQRLTGVERLDVEAANAVKSAGEQWTLIITLIDGKGPSIVDTTLRFSTQTLASRAALKITDAIREKKIANMQVVGPFQLSE